MSVKTPRFEGPFKWSALRQRLLSLREDVQSIRKLAGRNVTVDEYPGQGSVINISDTSARRPTGGGGGVGACCYDDGTCDDLSETDCTDAGGNWQGEDTTCDDTGVCVGACCEGEDGTTCVDNSTPDSCAADGGTWTDFGITCDSSPCVLPPCSGCGFDAFDGSGRKFQTLTATMNFTDDQGDYCHVDLDATNVLSCDGTCAPSGNIHRTQFGVDLCNVTPTCGAFSFDPVTGTPSSLWTGVDLIGLDGHLCQVCQSITVNQTSLTTTQADFDLTNAGSGTGTATFTLSDECDPGGFSPPP